MENKEIKKQKTNKKESIIQAIKFTFFSAGAGLIQIGSYTLLFELLDTKYWPAYLTSLILSVLFNFTVNRKFTFKSCSNIPIAMIKVCVYYLIFTPLSTIVGDKLEQLQWNGYLILILTMLVNFITEFLYQKFFVFKEKKVMREWQEADDNKVISLLNKELGTYSREYLEFVLNKNNNRQVYEINNKLVGLLAFGKWERNENNGKFIIYVSKKYRNKGIGNILYQKALDYAKEMNAQELETLFCEEDKYNEFYIKKGFNKWYKEYVMTYSNDQIITNSKMNYNIVHYDDSMFHEYVNDIRECFYEMRKENDFKPYYCLDFTEELRKNLLNDKDNIFVLKDENKIISSYTIHDKTNDTIDTLYVNKEYQGKGYGKLTIQLAINEAISRNVKNITLTVVENNIKARNLYEKLGFTYTQTSNSYKK